MKELNDLSALMLKLDNEEMLYRETKTIIEKRIKEVAKKYRIGIEINNIIYDYCCKTPEDFKKEYDEFISKKADKSQTYGDYFEIDFENSNDKIIAYSLKTTGNVEYIHPEKAECKLYQMFSASKSNGEKAITTIVQYFEEYLASFLRANIIEKPEAYLFDKQIKYSEIIEKDVDLIKKDIIQQEVKNLMYDVISTIKRIDSINKYNLADNEVFDKYKEINMHRNIIIHNCGCVNSDYNNNVSKKYKKELNTEIECDQKLIDEDILTIEKFAFLLSFLHGKSESDIEMLENVAFDALCAEKWEFCKYAYDLMRKEKTIPNDLRASFTANYLLSCKKLEGLEKTREIIEKFDVSGMETSFVMAKDLLLEKNQEVVSDLNAVFDDAITAYMVECWPIFIDFRKTEEYLKFVKDHSSSFSAYYGTSGVDEEICSEKNNASSED